MEVTWTSSVQWGDRTADSKASAGVANAKLQRGYSEPVATILGFAMVGGLVIRRRK